MLIPEFRSITLQDQDDLEAVRSLVDNPFTALSFPSLYTWKDTLKLSMFKGDGFCSVYSEHDKGYFCPMGDVSRYMELIDSFIQVGKSFKIMYLSEAQAERLKIEKGAEIQVNRNLSEYLYDAAALAFEEKPARNFRRRVYNFQKKYDYQAKLITNEDLPELFRFVQEEKDSIALEDDADALIKALEAYNKLHMTGVILRGSRNLAFMIGYQNTQDIFTMTVIRSTPEWRSISVAACEHELAKHICSTFRYVDLEEDLGIPGLRNIKTLTKPIKMLDAWEAYFFTNNNEDSST